MITTIQGLLSESTPVLAVIEINGLGYAVNVPLTTAEKLPHNGNNVKLYTHVVYKEDAQNLYGFIEKEDREFFRLLVEKVSGIGPKIALNIMSRMSVDTLKTAIAQSDTPLLSKCPGIGKKTAERLVIELRDKVFPSGINENSIKSNSTTETSSASSNSQDAISALIALGYKPADADKAIRTALNKIGAEATTEELIKYSFG